MLILGIRPLFIKCWKNNLAAISEQWANPMKKEICIGSLWHLLLDYHTVVFLMWIIREANMFTTVVPSLYMPELGIFV